MRFAPGAVKDILAGALGPGDSRRYLVNARDHQELTVSLLPPYRASSCLPHRPRWTREAKPDSAEFYADQVGCFAAAAMLSTSKPTTLRCLRLNSMPIRCNGRPSPRYLPA